MSLTSEGMYLTAFQRQLLQENLKKELPNFYRQRLKIILLTDDGATQAEICRNLKCCAATASRWIQLTKTGAAHKYLEAPVGRPKIVTDEYIEFLRELLQHSPKDYGYPFKSWTISWLCKHISKKIGIKISESHLKRVMCDLGLSTRAKAQKEKLVQKGASIFIADLKDALNSNSEERKPLEPNLLQIKLDSKIYDSTFCSQTDIASATQRNL